MPRAFTCPYHGWTFSNEGKLTSVPSRSAFDVEQLANRDLIALPVAEAHGFILVHPQPDGHVDFDEFFGPMKDHLAGYHYENLRLVREYRAPGADQLEACGRWRGRGLSRALSASRDCRPDDAAAIPAYRLGGCTTRWCRSGPTSPSCATSRESEWPEYCNFSTSNAIFPKHGGWRGRADGVSSSAVRPGATPGECEYIFRLYGWGAVDARRGDSGARCPDRRPAGPGRAGGGYEGAVHLPDHDGVRRGSVDHTGPARTERAAHA